MRNGSIPPKGGGRGVGGAAFSMYAFLAAVAGLGRENPPSPPIRRATSPAERGGDILEIFGRGGNGRERNSAMLFAGSSLLESEELASDGAVCSVKTESVWDIWLGHVIRISEREAGGVGERGVVVPLVFQTRRLGRDRIPIQGRSIVEEVVAAEDDQRDSEEGLHF